MLVPVVSPTLNTMIQLAAFDQVQLTVEGLEAALKHHLMNNSQGPKSRTSHFHHHHHHSTLDGTSQGLGKNEFESEPNSKTKQGHRETPPLQVCKLVSGMVMRSSGKQPQGQAMSM